MVNEKNCFSLEWFPLRLCLKDGMRSVDSSQLYFDFPCIFRINFELFEHVHIGVENDIDPNVAWVRDIFTLKFD